MLENNRANFLINVAYYLVIAAALYLGYKYLLGILLPFLVAVAVGFAAQKPAAKIAKKLHLRSKNVAALAAVFIYVAIGACVVAAVWVISASIPDVTGNITSLMRALADKIGKFSGSLKGINEALPEQLRGIIENLPSMVAERAGAALAGFASNAVSFAAKSVPSFFFGLVIAVMASVYFARDFAAVKNFLISVMPQKNYKNLIKIKNIFLSNVLKMLKGYGTLCLVTFGILTAGFLLLGIKNSVFYAAVISLIDALPVLGVGIALLPWAVAVIISGNVKLGVFLVLLYLVVTLVRNVLEPRVLSAKLGIPPLLSLLIIFVGLKLFGFFGMLLSFISLVIFIDYYRDESC